MIQRIEYNVVVRIKGTKEEKVITAECNLDEDIKKLINSVAEYQFVSAEIIKIKGGNEKPCM